MGTTPKGRETQNVAIPHIRLPLPHEIDANTDTKPINGQAKSRPLEVKRRQPCPTNVWEDEVLGNIDSHILSKQMDGDRTIRKPSGGAGFQHKLTICTRLWIEVDVWCVFVVGHMDLFIKGGWRD